MSMRRTQSIEELSITDYSTIGSWNSQPSSYLVENAESDAQGPIQDLLLIPEPEFDSIGLVLTLHRYSIVDNKYLCFLSTLSR